VSFFFKRWLTQKEDPRVGLRPHRIVELTCGYDEAFERVRNAIELALGAYISIDDKRGGLLEAAFGTVNNERVRCSFDRTGDERTSVRVEAFFPAGVAIRSTSPAVDALADMLERDVNADR
jgi:hypothetical protein